LIIFIFLTIRFASAQAEAWIETIKFFSLSIVFARFASAQAEAWIETKQALIIQ